MSDLVDATPGACAQFVQSLGLPELKAKRLLAALGGAAPGEVPPAIVACTHVCPRATCHGAVVGAIAGGVNALPGQMPQLQRSGCQV